MTLSTAAIADASLRLKLPVRRLSARLVPVIPGLVVAGSVLPVRHRGSVDVFFDAMLEAKPGDVLVIDNDGRMDEGCIGDLTVIEAMQYKLGAMVVWGCHRDTRELRELRFPVFSLGACAMGPQRLESGDPDVVPGVDGVAVRRGDFLVADDDGIFVFDGRHRPALLRAAEEIVRSEREQAALVRAGTTLHQQFRWEEFTERRAKDPAWTLRQHLQEIGKAIEV